MSRKSSRSKKKTSKKKASGKKAGRKKASRKKAGAKGSGQAQASNASPPDAGHPPEPPQTAGPAELDAEGVPSITLQVHPLKGGFPCHGHIEAQLRTTRQRQGMRRLFDSLVDEGAKLENGRPIASYADVMKYIAELAGAAA